MPKELTCEKTAVSQVPVPEAVIWNRAWHSAAEFLQFPDRTFDTPSSYLEYAKHNSLKKQITPEAAEALAYLMSPSSPGRYLYQGLKESDLIYWYCNEIRRHFITNIQSILCTVCEDTMIMT